MPQIPAPLRPLWKLLIIIGFSMQVNRKIDSDATFAISPLGACTCSFPGDTPCSLQGKGESPSEPLFSEPWCLVNPGAQPIKKWPQDTGWETRPDHR
jgi:hypothetical protein